MDECSLYLLRVWRAAQRFHASVRAVGDERAMHFEQAEQLVAFLQAPDVDSPPNEADTPANERTPHA